jgi:hypothetical protein
VSGSADGRASADAPDGVVVSTTGTPQIRVGDPNRTVRGVHRYVVTYTVDGVVSGDRLAWDAVGTAWTAPIAHVEVHLICHTVPRYLGP